VLAGGVASCAALLAAAVVSFQDPHAAGEARLARLSGEVADGVADEWRRLARDPDALEAFDDVAAGPRFAWEPAADGGEAERSGAPTGDGRGAQEPPGADPGDAGLEPAAAKVFDVLLGEAARLERAGEPAKALALARDAAGRKVDAGRRARGALRVIQLALAAGEPDLARATWKAEAAALTGKEALDGTSLLLLDALAAAPALPEEERRAAGERRASTTHTRGAHHRFTAMRRGTRTRGAHASAW